MRIGLIIIATGEYNKYVLPLIKSAKKYFMPNHSVTFFVFTDDYCYDEEAVSIRIDHLPFPMTTLLRYHRFVEHGYHFEDIDYLYYIDADTLIVDTIGNEILGDLVAVQHCGFVNKRGSYEQNPKSTAFVNPSEGNIYFGGGFNGGRKELFLKMAETISENIDKDLKHNFIACWHDESHLNRYLIDNPPTVVLSPIYHYPEPPDAHHDLLWKQAGVEYKPKILLLKK